MPQKRDGRRYCEGEGSRYVMSFGYFFGGFFSWFVVYSKGEVLGIVMYCDML